MIDRLQAIAAQAATSPEEALAQLEALHQEVLENPEARRTFEQEAPKVADGLYLPHLFWMYLAAFRRDPASYRPFLEYLLQLFVQQPSSPAVEKRLRPLLCIYLSEESPFYIEKLWDFFQRHARVEKYEYMESVKSFIARNPNTVQIFRKKFELVGDYFPDFELFSLPLPQLRQELEGQAS